MAGYYRGFCLSRVLSRNFASLVAPLTDLLRLSQTFSWTPACERAFTGVKDLLCNAQFWPPRGTTVPFRLKLMQALWVRGLSCCRTPRRTLRNLSVTFQKKISRTQYKYSTIEKEALALLRAVNHFEVYLGGSTFPVKVYTDHNPLVFLNRMYNTNLVLHFKSST